MRRVIINADDFGLGLLTNAAIARCLTERRISSASLCVNAPAALDALTWTRSHPDQAIGLHVNLSHFSAVAVSGRLAPDGAFHGLLPLYVQQACSPAVFRRAVREEVRAQLDLFVTRAGRAPSHMDSHLWAQMLPSVFSVMLEAAVDTGIHWMRNIEEPSRLRALARVARCGGLAPAACLKTMYQLSKSLLLWAHSRLGRYRRRLANAAVGCPDEYFGVSEGLLYGTVEQRVKILEHILAAAPSGGISEIMVHPGADEQVEGMRYSAHDALTETAALLSPEWGDRLKQYDVMLVKPGTHREGWKSCGSPAGTLE